MALVNFSSTHMNQIVKGVMKVLNSVSYYNAPQSSSNSR